MLLELEIEQLERPEELGPGSMPALELELQRALRHALPDQQLQLQLQLAAAGGGEAHAEPERDWQQLPWTALINPVCVATQPGDTGGGGDARGDVLLGLLLLPGSPGLQARPRVIVSGQGISGSSSSSDGGGSSDGSSDSSSDGSGGSASSAWAGGAGAARLSESGSSGGSFCWVLGSGQVWAAAERAKGHRSLSISLPGCREPAALALHLLPGAAAGAAQQAGGGGGHHHPLASLPLLCLPQPAADEVLQLFARMAQEVAAEGKAPGRPEAARRAYWLHYAPFASDWRDLFAAAAAPGAGVPASSRELLAFLSRQGMAACLELATTLLLPLLLPAAEAEERQELLLASTGSSESGAAGPAPHAAAGPGSEASWAPGRPGKGGAAHPLPLRTLLCGFSAGAAEDPYLCYRNARCMQRVDWPLALVALLVAAAGLVVQAAQARRRPAQAQVEPLAWLGLAVCNAPWLVLLASPRWYLRHREVLLVALGGTARALLALVYGVLPAAAGAGARWAGPAGAQEWQRGRGVLAMLLVGCVLHFPLTQQVRLRRAAALSAVDAAGVACCAAATLGSWLAGLGCGGAAYLLALLFSAALERQCRAAFMAR
jgi:hypothetical protein